VRDQQSGANNATLLSESLWRNSMMQSAQLAIPITDQDHSLGPGNAPVTLLEYGDFECPYCRAAHPILQGVRRKMGDRLRLVFRHFPLAEAHPHAEHAAEAAEAAGAQGRFWEMHDLLFENQSALDDDDLAMYAAKLGLDAQRVAREIASGTYVNKIRGDFRGGIRSGVNGTPTLFINGLRFDGNWTDPDELVQALNDAATQVHVGAP
jgi:protein-disulfide isomerase